MAMLSGLAGRVLSSVKVRGLKQQAERGDAEAMTCLGLEYSDRKDFPEAFRWWRKAADLGSPGAQFMLGVAYDQGNGIDTDKVESVRWYRLAAEQGYITAQSALGTNYLLGEGVTKDVAEGLRWYQAAAEQGDRDTQILLGGLYANSEFVPTDKTEAARWYQALAEQGDTEAQILFGSLYANSESLPNYKAEAVRWYSAAFKASKLTASLAERYDTELKWFLWAADSGDGDVALNVANIYSSEGGGVPQDDVESNRWYQMAADMGNEEALVCLGHMYETGRGVSLDYAEAMRWYQMAAERGNAGAMFNIALMYTRSEGVTIDAAELYFWFQLCSINSFPEPQRTDAQKMLGILQTKLAPESIAEIHERIREWNDNHPPTHFR